MTGAPQYLLVVYLSQRRETGPVSPGSVADALEKSPSATTEMLQRLDTRGLVSYEPYEGATLTTDGRETAEELFEIYVTLSRFFRDVLDLDGYELEAMEMVGTIGPTVAEQLATTLLTDDATIDPDDLARPFDHGDGS